MPDLKLWWESLRFADPVYFSLFGPVGILFLAAVLIFALKLAKRPRKTKFSRYKLFGVDSKWAGALILCVVSVVVLARPQVSGSYTINYGGNIRVAVAFDKSASMRSTDLKPSRHAVAVRIVTGLVDSGVFTPGDKISLFTFAGQSNWRMPFSEDLDDFKVKLAEIEHPEVYQEESQLYTDFSRVLEHIPVALDKQDGAFGKLSGLGILPPPMNTVVIMVSDGDDRENAGLDPALKELKKRGIKVFTVGVGTRTGVEITIRAYNPDFPGDPQKIDKTKVKTVLNTKRLKEIADKTGGEMYTVESEGSSVINSLRFAVNSNRSYTPRLTYSEKRRDVWWDILAFCCLVTGLLTVIYTRG